MNNMQVNIETIREVDDLNELQTLQLTHIGQIHENPEILARLAKHDNAFVRAAVASNPHITQEIADLLKEDIAEGVKHALSKNPTLQSAIGPKGVEDTLDVVREEIKGEL